MTQRKDIEVIARGLHGELSELHRECGILRAEIAELRDRVERIPAAVEVGTRLLYDHLEFLRSDIAGMKIVRTRARRRPRPHEL